MQLRPFIGVRGVTATQVIKIKESNLATRIISAFVMMPLVIFITYLGYPYFNFLVGFCSVLMAWEYNRIISGSRQDYAGFVLIIGLVSAVIMVSTATVMSAFYYLKIIKTIYFDDSVITFDLTKNKKAQFSIFASCIFLVTFFLYPSIFNNMVTALFVS